MSGCQVNLARIVTMPGCQVDGETDSKHRSKSYHAPCVRKQRNNKHGICVRVEKKIEEILKSICFAGYSEIWK